MGAQPTQCRLIGARFHTTVAQSRQLPRGNIPEAAFAGRSNAGKSSAINALCQRRRLAFASNTPGRTQALNYFALGREPDITAFLVDMPGYGYAVADKVSKAEWGRLSGRYLADRAPLVAVVLVVDIRRGIGPLDELMLDWVRPDQRLLVLASKADKLNRQQQAAAVADIRRALAERPTAQTEVIAFSAPANQGIASARALIESWLERPAAAPSDDDHPADPADPAEPPEPAVPPIPAEFPLNSR